MTGTLSGPASSVTIKVAGRHGLRLPTTVAVLVLLLAAGFVLYTSSLMGERANRLLLRAQLRRRSDVRGLDDWVARAEHFLTWDQMRSLVGWMRARGKQRADKARASLAATEGEIGLEVLPRCPLREAAEAEARRTDVLADELVSDRGELLDLPATRLENELRQAEGLVRSFDAKVETLEPLIPEERKPDAKALVAQSRSGLVALSPGDVESTLPAQLNETIAQLMSYIGPGAPAAFMATEAWAVPPTVTAAAKERIRGAVDFVAASWPILLAIVVLMVVATIAALSTSYARNQTFATAWDYTTLAVGVFGSTSVAGIVTAALLWRRSRPQT